MKFDSGVTVALSSIVLGALLFFGLGKGEKNDGGYSAKEATAFKILKQRPVNLPNLATSGPCPITHGNRSTVPKVDYIFCSGCFWFGKGPTFLAFSWSDQSTDEARFSVARIPYEKHAYRAKTPFVSKPEY